MDTASKSLCHVSPGQHPAEDTPCLFFHGAAMHSSAQPQVSFDGLVQISDCQNSHVSFPPVKNAFIAIIISNAVRKIKKLVPEKESGMEKCVLYFVMFSISLVRLVMLRIRNYE
jgi:hypothetical protein